MTDFAITPSLRRMLERIRDQSGSLQVLQITANGRAETKKLEMLISNDLAEIVDHPSVKHGKRPAAAISITEKGKNALGDKS